MASNYRRLNVRCLPMPKIRIIVDDVHASHTALAENWSLRFGGGDLLFFIDRDQKKICIMQALCQITATGKLTYPYDKY